MAIFVPRFVRQLRDVLLTAPADGEVLTYDSADEKWKNEAGGGGGGPPTGAAGGVLGGTYPNPGFAVDMATQAELDAHVTDITDAHDATSVSVAPFGTIAATQVQAALEEIVAEAVTDLGPAVILAPASSARNVIQPTAADVRNLTLSPTAATTEALQVWLDQAGNPTAWIGSGENDASIYADVNTHFLLSRAGSGGFFDPNAGAAFTPGASGSSAGMWGDFEVLPTANNDNYHYGIVGDNRLGVTTREVVAIYGFLYDVWHLGTKPAGTGAQITHLVGGGANAYTLNSGSTGDVTDMVGFEASAAHGGTGLVATLKGLRASATALSDAGVVTDAYGLHVEAVGNATKVVNAYGIRIATPLASSLAYAIKVDGGKSLFTDGLVIALIAAPADAAYANGEGGWWWDQANSLPKWKGKTSGGVVVNFTPVSETTFNDHSARHESGGADAIKLDDLAAPDDNTDLNASTTAHGLLRKLSNIATEYLDGTGAWSTPAGGGGGGAPTTATYITQTADAGLSAEQALSALATGLVKNTTGTGVLSIGAAGTDYYAPGGTDVALADGGTGASLTDPNADRLMFWDDSAGATAYLTPGTNLTITGTTIDAAGGAAYPARARAVISGVTQYSIPGWTQTISPSTWTASANRAQYFPIFVEDEMVIDRIVVELTTGVAISTMRLCIYNADTSWQPTSLVTNTDTGDVLATVASVGVIATTITDTTLAPGRYLAWLATSTGNHVFRSIRGSGSIYLGYPVALGANSVFSQIWIAQTYAAPPSTGLAWTTGNVGSTHFDHPVFVRIKTP